MNTFENSLDSFTTELAVDVTWKVQMVHVVEMYLEDMLMLVGFMTDVALEGLVGVFLVGHKMICKLKRS